MTLFPDIQRRAQAEIDRVVGPRSDRLPEFSDQESLPYITALVKETLRWAPPLPLGKLRSAFSFLFLSIVLTSYILGTL